PLFDGDWYLGQHPDLIDQGINPLIHYLQRGSAQGYDPGPSFSSSSHCARYPELDPLYTSPLVHYVSKGSDQISKGTDQTPHSSPPDEPKNASDTGERSSSAWNSNGLPSLLAFYLPQFHPIPENDQWWGSGFTEWANVTTATPAYPGHQQPKLPSELGFYDLRLPEIRERQASLAKEYGISGFCYYYYWFEGRRVLERPLDEVLASGSPDFPLCICWANENWTRRWDGLDDEILMRQEHSLSSDYRFIQDVIPIFKDPRYIRVDGAPLLLIYRAEKIKDPEQTTAMWRDAAIQAGLPGIHLCAVKFRTDDPRPIHFDSAVEFPPHHFPAPPSEVRKLVLDETFSGEVFDYAAGVAEVLKSPRPDYVCYRTVMPAWDNTARRGPAATIFHGATPRVYERWLTGLLAQAQDRTDESNRFIFINAWNEWAEGAHLEPDALNGRANLEATRRALKRCASEEAAIEPGLANVSSDLPSTVGTAYDRGVPDNAAFPGSNKGCGQRSPKPLLFIGHDAAAAGSQFVLLELLQAMAKSMPEYQAHMALHEGGALLADYEELVPVTILNGPPDPGTQSHAILTSMIGDLKEQGLGSAICNTVVTASATELCAQEELSVLLLVHEQPSSIDELFGGERTMSMINRNADCIVGVSKFSLEALKIRYGPLNPKLSVLHPPMREIRNSAIDREIEAQGVVEGVSDDESRHVVFGCGTLYPRKGPDLFIQVARKVKQSRPDMLFRFVWVGGALTPDGVENHRHFAAEAGVDDMVEFKGEIKEVAPYFLSAEVFCLTSREDPFPLVNMEAMSFGLPVIAFSDAGGAPELIEDDAGIVVPHLDVDSMAAAIIRLAEEPDLRLKLGKRAREKVSNRFSPEAYAESLLALLQGIAPKSEKRGGQHESPSISA
ncbi:MAG: glycoside hydrolase family 99-like domain-containing protein, partial [Myxococcales bacterium]